MHRTTIEMSKDEFYNRGGILDRIMETAFDSCLLIEADGTIIHATNNSDFLRLKPQEECIGKNLSEVNPLANFALDTLKTHKGHWGVIEVTEDRKCLLNIFPIFCEKEFIGILGTILYSSLAALNKIISQLKDTSQGEDAEKIYNAIARIGTSLTFADYVGESPKIKDLMIQCKKAAGTNLPILLVGESGTGKEILANSIHSASLDRTWKPFIRLNCSAIPKDLIESELFGYEKGAFTGASSVKKGKFELASGGSILLDEIGDMDIGLQSKLLRVLEEKEFERVGGTKVLSMSARIISSTNSDIRNKSRAGEFRADLYYRLSTIEIRVPPLREHAEDIPLLVEHFIKRDQLDIILQPCAMKALSNYNWPGNVREFRNVLNRIGLFCEGHSVSASDVMSYIGDYPMLSPEPKTAKPENSAVSERERLAEALNSCDFSVSAAAKKLGVCRATVYNMMDRYDIKRNKHI